MPEPDVSVVRGQIDDYLDFDPGPEDLALVVEVSDSMVRADRALAATYLGGGVPLYWLVNIQDRQLEVFTREAGSQAPMILGESDAVDLVIAGRMVDRIAVAELLPPHAKRAR